MNCFITKTQSMTSTKSWCETATTQDHTITDQTHQTPKSAKFQPKYSPKLPLTRLVTLNYYNRQNLNIVVLQKVRHLHVIKISFCQLTSLYAYFKNQLGQFYFLLTMIFRNFSFCGLELMWFLKVINKHTI